MDNHKPHGSGLNYINSGELAAKLSVSRNWVQRYTRAGIIPAIKIGQQYFYSPDAVDAALQKLTV